MGKVGNQLGKFGAFQNANRDVVLGAQDASDLSSGVVVVNGQASFLPGQRSSADRTAASLPLEFLGVLLRGYVVSSLKFLTVVSGFSLRGLSVLLDGGFASRGGAIHRHVGPETGATFFNGFHNGDRNTDYYAAQSITA